MEKPSGIIFDFGDTVLCSESSDWLAAGQVLLDCVDKKTGLTVQYVQQIASDMSNQIFQTADKAMVQYKFEDFLKLLCETLDVNLKVSYSEVAKRMWNSGTKYVPMEGIFEVLDFLNSHQIKTGILSNSEFSGSVLSEELSKHHLLERFSFVISSCDYGVRKPHKYIFDLAIKKLNVKPQSVWFIGDNLDCDISGASQSGLFPVWLNYNSIPNKIGVHCLEIKSLGEFLGIIQYNKFK